MKGFLLLELTVTIAIVAIATPAMVLSASYLLQNSAHLIQAHRTLTNARSALESLDKTDPNISISRQGTFTQWSYSLKSTDPIQVITVSR
ncbi:hypothetical protein EBR96_08600 [bacterium]|nr:hypothetical protein [bacterium]